MKPLFAAFPDSGDFGDSARCQRFPGRQTTAAAFCRALSLAPLTELLPQWRHSEAVVIKTATLVALGWRSLRSNRRAGAAVFVSQGAVWGRLQAKRVHNRWRLGLPATLVSFRAALGPGIIVVSLLWPNGWALTACIGLALLSNVLDGVLARR